MRYRTSDDDRLRGVPSFLQVGVHGTRTLKITDPTRVTYLNATFAIVALLACWMPPRRATRVEAMVALRQD